MDLNLGPACASTQAQYETQSGPLHDLSLGDTRDSIWTLHGSEPERYVGLNEGPAWLSTWAILIWACHESPPGTMDFLTDLSLSGFPKIDTDGPQQD